MTKKEIYLIRHGETDYNRQRIVQGSGIDADLNDWGKAQAQAFYENFQDLDFDKIYTSKLKRAIQSVDAFLQKGLPHESYEGLNEISWGIREGKKITPEGDESFQMLMDAWRNGDVDIPLEGGESPLQVQQRQKPVLDLILSRPEEKRILICMHGRAMRMFLCLMLNYPLSKMDLFEHSNLCLYKITHTGNLFQIDQYFYTEHLKDLSPIMH